MIILPKRDSQNKKLGRGVRATYRTVGADGAGTCPASCSHLATGACYALGGRVALHAKRGTRDETDASALRAWVDTLPRHTLVRHHVSGDVCTDGTPDREYIRAIREAHADAPRGVRGYGYTHAWESIDPLDLSGPRLVFNASADSFEAADRAVAAGWPTTIVVAPDAPRVGTTPAGYRWVVCPNQTRGTSCADCTLCARPLGKRPIIAFRAHGGGKRKAQVSE